MSRPGHRRGARTLASLGTVLMVLGATAGVAAAPGPAFAAGCSSSVPGVTMVVDFAALGGGVVVGCAPGDPSSGYAALHAAGFTTAGTQHDGPAFVCRINGKPAPAREPCVLTPPASAYWSYWHARPGGTWSYSQLGAMSYNPAPGSVEGWAFGAGSPPSIAPPRLVTPPAASPTRRTVPTTGPPAKGPPGPAPPATTRPAAAPPAGAGGAPPAGTSAAPRASDPPAVSGSVAAGTPPDGPAGVAVGSGPGPTGDRPQADTPASGRSSSPLGTVVGVGIVAVVAAAAGFSVWWRRRSGRWPGSADRVGGS